MKKIGLIAALAAVICGIAVYLYISGVEQRIAAASRETKVETADILVAAREIPPFTEITEDMLAHTACPADYVRPEMATEAVQVLGLQADGTIVEGEPFLMTKLGTSETLGASLSYDIPAGMRAMTVSLGTDAGTGGYITKGDRIDLMMSLAVDPKSETDYSRFAPDSDKCFRTEERITTVVLKDAEVLELGEVTFDSEAGGLYSGLTLALTPEECLQVFSAMEQGGDFYALLRPRGGAGDPSETERQR